MPKIVSMEEMRGEFHPIFDNPGGGDTREKLVINHLALAIRRLFACWLRLGRTSSLPGVNNSSNACRVLFNMPTNGARHPTMGQMEFLVLSSAVKPNSPFPTEGKLG
jgi:hypothetical protein